jgi:poly(3-hydroxybutyrate) depolymerase
MEEDAVPKGYAVVYVTGAPDSTDPTSANGWNSGISKNENDDVGFIVSLTEYLQDEYGFDKDRTYAAGFSNGAFMMHRLAMDAQDVFSAVASVCGKMSKSVWDRRYGSNQVGVLQISGEKDDVVPKALDGSATYAYDPGIEDVMQYWADSNGISQCVDESIGKNSTITKYGDTEGHKVWSVMVKDGRHSWYDEGLTGIDVNGLIIEFFEAQTGMPSAD